MEHVIESLVDAGVFQSEDVLWLFDNTNRRAVALVVAADKAGVSVSDIETG